MISATASLQEGNKKSTRMHVKATGMLSTRPIIPILTLALCLHTAAAQAKPPKKIPSKNVLLKMATRVEFSTAAVTDDPVPPKAKEINPGFRIAVYYRTSGYSTKPTPAEGGIVAKVFITGVPKERSFPDGDYFLWVGGPDDSMEAVMVKVDGSVRRKVDVRSEPSLAEETMPHPPRVHVVIEPTAAANQGALPLPPLPQPLPTRSWREICVYPPSDHGGKRWIRVPDN